jgi:hypothetical protein
VTAVHHHSNVVSRVAEPENLKTVPVPTFYLITVLVLALVSGHIPAHTYTCMNTYRCMCTYL